MPLNIVIAPNAFKNALSSIQASKAIEAGLIDSHWEGGIRCVPVADGGDHTMEVLVDYFSGYFVTCSDISDPLGRSISARYGIVDIYGNKTAVVELAEASGMRRLKAEELTPLHTTSYGTGQLIAKAVKAGIRHIILGVGGSATVDGGTGMLKALGFSFLNKNSDEISEGGGSLIQMDKIMPPENNILEQVRLEVFCDVKNPLLGPEGAARVFGPQKGADHKAVEQLEAGLTKFAQIAEQLTGNRIDGVAGGGAAGGAAAGSLILGATLSKGGRRMLELMKFADILGDVACVITAEGQLDIQTLEGKAPYEVARMAKEKNLPVIALTGAAPSKENAELSRWFDVILPIGRRPASLEVALSQTTEDLRRTACQAGNLLVLLDQSTI
ncbi:glycerate kinase [Roseivirga sp. BDSF3-8]|uniref:glycerate kinase n=1 Tax=Roseivirga sp. BDSF3-8 TaxID=3241598 RepID=UPI0035325E32